MLTGEKIRTKMPDLNSSSDEETQLVGPNTNYSAAIDMELDDSTVKFIPNGGKMDNEEKSSAEISFTGLGKEELLKYADDPFWKKVRLILLIIFWVGWIAMLVAAIIIIVLAPRCPERPDQKWYDKETVYQAYPKSFKDSTVEPGLGAGVGDINGIKSKVEYLKDVGTKSLYISSFYKSDGVDGDMGIVDHKAIEAMFGTMSDFEALRKDTKKKNMYLILDFIPNHTSDKHEWFEKSRNKEGKYTDYYVWAPCTSSTKPNNWLSVHGGSAWKYDDVRNECYLHQFLSSQPDLNLRNSDVQDELKSILRFWLDKGVDGFNILGAEYLLENNDTSVDEPAAGQSGIDSDDYTYLEHTETTHQPGNAALISSWRAVVDAYNTKPGREKLLLVSVNGNFSQTKMYHRHGDQTLANFMIIKPDVDFASGNLVENIANWIQMNVLDNTTPKAWRFGDQNSQRLATAAGKNRVKVMLSLQMLLPGVPVNYYGNELGMVDGTLTFNQTKDILGREAGEANYQKVSRDPYRTPMQWDSSDNAGFSVLAPWLPVNSDYQQINVDAQKSLFSDRIHNQSSLSTFKQLVKLREKESFQWGATKVGVANDILWFTRKAEGFPGYLTIMNLGDKHQTPAIIKETGISKDVELAFHSHYEIKEDNSKVDLKKSPINVDSNHVVVLKYAA